MANPAAEELSSISTENFPESPTFKATRNYTSPAEKHSWWYIKRWSQDWKGSYYNSQPFFIDKEEFRTRRSSFKHWRNPHKVAVRMRFENSNEIGTFIKLTNSYCLTCTDGESSLNTIRGDLPDEIPVINTSLGGCRILGRMCVGNKHGLLVPEIVYNTELHQLKNELPETVKVQQLEERLSALGNVIACNDKVALVHPDIDKGSEEIIADTLQVEVFRHMIANSPLVGSYCVLSNSGGLVSPGVSNTELENLSSLLEIPIVSGTVNSGCKVIAAGLIVNDWMAYAGMKTDSKEFSVIESIFQLQKIYPPW